MRFPSLVSPLAPTARQPALSDLPAPKIFRPCGVVLSLRVHTNALGPPKLNRGAGARSRAEWGRRSQHAHAFVRDGILSGRFPVGAPIADADIASELGSRRPGARGAEAARAGGPARARAAAPAARSRVHGGAPRGGARDPRGARAGRGAPRVPGDADRRDRPATAVAAPPAARRTERRRLRVHRPRRGLPPHARPRRGRADRRAAAGAARRLRPDHAPRRARSAEELLAVVAEHEQIVDALESRDEQAAVRALAAHLHAADPFPGAPSQ